MMKGNSDLEYTMVIKPVYPVDRSPSLPTLVADNKSHSQFM